MHWISPEKAIIILEWIGTFFFAVEAIKLHNLAVVRQRLHSFERGLNPIEGLIKRAPNMASAEKRAGTIFNLWLLLGLGLMAAIISLTNVDPTTIRGTAATYLPAYPYASDIFLVVCILVGLPLLTLAGYFIFKCVLLVIATTVRALTALERNTSNGVVGIIGFLLFSAAAIMKLAGFH